MPSASNIQVTVIIPTYGNAPYVRSAIASAQAQTVRELEICVILDGSPPGMHDIIKDIQKEDPRIRMFAFPKASRTGEIHRAAVIPQTAGSIICYLSHDDLWFPQHVECMGHMLSTVDFGHSLHVGTKLGLELGDIVRARPMNLARKRYREAMLFSHPSPVGFGLTCTAHTRAAYDMLDEGWALTPDGVNTDLHMWRKFLSQPGIRVGTYPGVTSLHFPKPYWVKRFTPDELAVELARAHEAVQDPLFREAFINRVAWFFMEQEVDVRRQLGAELRTQLRQPDVVMTREAMRDLIREELSARIAKRRSGHRWRRWIRRVTGRP